MKEIYYKNNFLLDKYNKSLVKYFEIKKFQNIIKINSTYNSYIKYSFINKHFIYKKVFSLYLNYYTGLVKFFLDFYSFDYFIFFKNFSYKDISFTSFYFYNILINYKDFFYNLNNYDVYLILTKFNIFSNNKNLIYFIKFYFLILFYLNKKNDNFSFKDLLLYGMAFKDFFFDILDFNFKAYDRNMSDFTNILYSFNKFNKYHFKLYNFDFQNKKNIINFFCKDFSFNFKRLNLFKFNKIKVFNFLKKTSLYNFLKYIKNIKSLKINNINFKNLLEYKYINLLNYRDRFRLNKIIKFKFYKKKLKYIKNIKNLRFKKKMNILNKISYKIIEGFKFYKGKIKLSKITGLFFSLRVRLPKKINNRKKKILLKYKSILAYLRRKMKLINKKSKIYLNKYLSRLKKKNIKVKKFSKK